MAGLFAPPYPALPAPLAPAPPAPTAVIGSQFCASYPVDLTVTQKAISLTDGDYTVTDVNGGVVFTVRGKLLSFRGRRVLLDAAGTPVVSMQQKVISIHKRWRVYRGDSADPNDLLFSVKKSSLIQHFKTELDVFMAANTREEFCDFKVKGSFFERSCTIYLGNSNTIIAQMSRKYQIGNLLLGKDTFGVTVYPNVDYAFVVALIVVLDGINDEKSD